MAMLLGPALPRVKVYKTCSETFNSQRQKNTDNDFELILSSIDLQNINISDMHKQNQHWFKK